VYDRTIDSGIAARGRFSRSLANSINAAGAASRQGRRLAGGSAASTSSFRNVSSSDFQIGDPTNLNTTSGEFSIPWVLTLSGSTPGGGNSSQVSAANATLRVRARRAFLLRRRGLFQQLCPPSCPRAEHRLCHHYSLRLGLYAWQLSTCKRPSGMPSGRSGARGKPALQLSFLHLNLCLSLHRRLLRPPPPSCLTRRAKRRAPAGQQHRLD
jgi:hypothetical protein